MSTYYSNDCDQFYECILNESKNGFDIQNRKKELVAQYFCPLEFDDEYNDDEFEIYPMYGKRNSENNIYQIYIDDKSTPQETRIGWILPMQSLSSNEHDFANDTFFLKYAYVTTKILLQSMSEEAIKNLQHKDSFLLEDVFDKDYILLVLSKNNCSKLIGFNLDDYVVSLYDNGYTFSKCDMSSFGTNELDVRLHLNSVSELLKGKSFITELFKSILPDDSLKPITQFHLIYQIVEIFIDEIFADKFKKITDQLKSDSGALFDLRDDLSKLTGEKYRVSELFNEYAAIRGEVDYIRDLIDLCNTLLAKAGKRTFKDAAHSIYAVRCLIFHDYSSIKYEDRVIVNTINDLLLHILIKMIYIFKLPESAMI